MRIVRCVVRRSGASDPINESFSYIANILNKYLHLLLLVVSAIYVYMQETTHRNNNKKYMFLAFVLHMHAYCTMRIHNCAVSRIYTKGSHNFKLFTLTYIHGVHIGPNLHFYKQ